ncbi:unnamed protein product [Auanema sp. JU1783]|nr:unnamed protein product [Auanema sp. JU1783]
MSEMLFWLLLIGHALTNDVGAFNMKWIDIDKCQSNEWVARNYIVFLCNSTFARGAVIRRELKPIACDPTNGLAARNKVSPVFIGQEYKGDDGFVYECKKDIDGSVTFSAKECFMEQERFLPGHYVRGSYNNMYLCYKELDKILRIRVFRPAHNKCNSLKENDPNCKLGIVQTVMNSRYGSATGFAYNTKTKLPITRPFHRAGVKPKTSVLDLRAERPSLSPQDLLQAIQGDKLPEELLNKKQ